MARTEQTPKERERKIDDILTAAKRIFLKKGYFNTTMLDIATEAELSRRTVYLYFNNKDDLSYEIVHRAYSQLMKMLLLASDSDKCGFEKLIDIKNNYIEYYKTNYEDFVFTLYFDFKINTQIVDEKQIKESFYLLQKMVTRVEECMKEGIKDGSIRPIEDVRLSAITAINIIHATMQKLAVRTDVIEVLTKIPENLLIKETFDIVFNSFKP